MKLRVPAMLAVSLVGCGDTKKPLADAKVVDAPCAVYCFSDGTDAGVCPDPPACVTENGPYGECPAGCFCSAICFPDVPGSGACETNPPQCAGPERTCPTGCTPLA
jgi:hypothetical protein